MLVHTQQSHLHQHFIPPLLSCIPMISSLTLAKMKILYIFEELLIARARWLYLGVETFFSLQEIKMEKFYNHSKKSELCSSWYQIKM